MKKSKLLTTMFTTTLALSIPFSIASAEDLKFNSCSDAWAQGYANIAKGEPGYSLKLDRDGDGIACELSKANGRYASKTADGTPLNKIKVGELETQPNKIVADENGVSKNTNSNFEATPIQPEIHEVKPSNKKQQIENKNEKRVNDKKTEIVKKQLPKTSAVK